jgi:hypothetical protein
LETFEEAKRNFIVYVENEPGGKKGKERKIHAEYCGCHTLILYADINMFHKCEANEEKRNIFCSFNISAKS